MANGDAAQQKVITVRMTRGQRELLSERVESIPGVSMNQYCLDQILGYPAHIARDAIGLLFGKSKSAMGDMELQIAVDLIEENFAEWSSEGLLVRKESVLQLAD